MKMIQLTIFDDPNKIIKTQYGSIPFCEWLGKEKTRIERDPKRKAKIIQRRMGLALFVNKI
jgi:hypothetical protein